MSPGQGPGYGPGQGPGYGPGQGPGYGSGQGPGYGSGQGSGYGSGQGPGYGPGQGPGYGPGQGHGQAPGYGPGQGPGYGPGQGPAAGAGITCPDCGRSVPPGTVKLCPSCGYPIMFETSQPAGESSAGVLRKPNVEPQSDPGETGMMAGTGSSYQPPVVSPQAALGPHCPACHHRNPAQRVRCEVCATELWPGAAAPVRRRPVITAPQVPPQGPRLPWAVIVAWILVAIAAVAVVLLLFYLAG